MIMQTLSHDRVLPPLSPRSRVGMGGQAGKRAQMRQAVGAPPVFHAWVTVGQGTAGRGGPSCLPGDAATLRLD